MSEYARTVMEADAVGVSMVHCEPWPVQPRDLF